MSGEERSKGSRDKIELHDCVVFLYMRKSLCDQSNGRVVNRRRVLRELRGVAE